MAYIGQQPSLGNYQKLDDISSQFNGITKSFQATIGGNAITIGTPFQLVLSLNGIIQEPEVSFTITNSSRYITFVDAPLTGSTFFALKFGEVLTMPTVVDGSITQAKYAASSISFDKLSSTVLASQAEAEAGSSSSKLMTPLRTAQAIAELTTDFTVSDFQAGKNVLLTGVITPSTLTTNTNNWNPTGLDGASTIRVSTNSNSITLTGIAGVTEGRILTLVNVGSYNLTLSNNTTSTEDNRFLLPSNFTLSPNNAITLRYDSTSLRWRTISFIDDFPIIHVRRSETAGTVGGSATTGSLQTLTLNTTVTNTITGASLASNIITLPAGTYRARANTPFYRTDSAYIQLYNSTDSTEIIQGQNIFSSSSSGDLEIAHLFSQFTITDTKNITLRYRATTGGNASNLGTAKSYSGISEIYSELIIEKIR